jgi:hypothetical protein
MPPFDKQNAAADLAPWLAGELDAELDRSSNVEIDQWRSRIPELEQSKKAPTAAAAWYTLAELLRTRMVVDRSQENLDAMAKAYRRAHELWPEGIPAWTLGNGLSTVAVGKARAESPALAKAWEADGRRLSILRLAYRASIGPDGAEVLAALRKQPELGEAATLRRGKLDGRPVLTDWILARLAGDVELEKETEKVFDRAAVRSGVEIEARIQPGQPEEQLDLELIRSRGKTQ